MASPVRPGQVLSRQDTLRTSGGSIAAAAAPAAAAPENEPVPLLAVSSKKDSRARQARFHPHFAGGCSRHVSHALIPAVFSAM